MNPDWRAATKQCARCGAPFGPHPREGPAGWARRRYCSPTCRRGARPRVPYLTCDQCGGRFWSQDRGQRFCSRPCAHQARQAEYARLREQWVSYPRGAKGKSRGLSA
jgi:hypothetical protein